MAQVLRLDLRFMAQGWKFLGVKFSANLVKSYLVQGVGLKLYGSGFVQGLKLRVYGPGFAVGFKVYGSGLEVFGCRVQRQLGEVVPGSGLKVLSLRVYGSGLGFMAQSVGFKV